MKQLFETILAYGQYRGYCFIYFSVATSKCVTPSRVLSPTGGCSTQHGGAVPNKRVLYPPGGCCQHHAGAVNITRELSKTRGCLSKTRGCLSTTRGCCLQHAGAVYNTRVLSTHGCCLQHAAVPKTWARGEQKQSFRNKK